jgi:hypothetical protein
MRTPIVMALMSENEGKMPFRTTSDHVKWPASSPP